MNAKNVFAAIICAVLAAASGLAHAGVVTFHVPLNLTSYPSSDVEIWCELRSAQDQPISASMKHVSVLNGASQGIQDVGVVYSPQQAGAITRYRCALVVETQSTQAAAHGSFGASGKPTGPTSIPAGVTILQQVGGPLQ